MIRIKFRHFICTEEFYPSYCPVADRTGGTGRFVTERLRIPIGA